MSEIAGEEILQIRKRLEVYKPSEGGYNEHIRGIYNWRDTYNNSKTYYLNDVVSYNNTHYIRTVESGGNEIPTDIACWQSMSSNGNSKDNMHFTFRENNSKAYIDHNKSTYALAQKIIFPGSDNTGIPTGIHVIASIEIRGGSDSEDEEGDLFKGQIRILDKTHGKIICENTNINTTTPTIFNLGTLSNVPTGISDWELQYNKGNSNTIMLYAMCILFN